VTSKKQQVMKHTQFDHPEKRSREPFTAKPPRAQRAYSTKKNLPFGEAENRSKPWISWHLCDLAVEVCILTAFLTIILLFVWPRHEQMARVAKNQIPGRVRETKKNKIRVRHVLIGLSGIDRRMLVNKVTDKDLP
jgi:hypothetical protein